jgi:hypothetical protein
MRCSATQAVHVPACAAAAVLLAFRAKQWQAAFCRWAAIVMAARRESHWWEDTGAQLLQQQRWFMLAMCILISLAACA